MSTAQEQMEEAWRRDTRNEARLRTVMNAIAGLLDHYEGTIPPGTREIGENLYQDCQAKINVIVRRWD